MRSTSAAADVQAASAVTLLHPDPSMQDRRMPLPALVAALGSPSFGACLLAYLHELCGADHCAAFRLGYDRVDRMLARSIDGTGTADRQAGIYVDRQYWRKDPVIPQARRCLAQANALLIHVDLPALADHEFRQAMYPNVRDRIVVAGRGAATAISLSILRAEGHDTFGEGDVNRVEGMADLLISLLDKHAELAGGRPDLSTALASLDQIENCFVAASELPRREVEVCARVLYGLSTVGISLELGIGTESVKTYRKRAYQRLGIGTERELCNWYLALWSAWRAQAGAASPLG